MKPRRKPLPTGPDGLPLPLRWRPVLSAGSLLFGVLLTLAAALLMQQLGAAELTVEGLLAAVLLGLVVGIVAPSLGRLAGVLWGNAIIRKARRQLAALPHGKVTP